MKKTKIIGTIGPASMDYNVMKNLVIGAGFSGATIANLLATQLGEEVVVIDKKDHISGKCFDYRDKNVIMIHKHGAHICQTHSEKILHVLKQNIKKYKYEN